MNIEFYESTEDLPIKRFQKFTKYLMNDSDVGSDFNAYNARILRLREFVDAGLKKEALDELINFKQALFNGINEISPSISALVMLIKTINGKPLNIYSDSEVDKAMKALDSMGFSKKDADNKVSEVKKNSILNFLNIFRNIFRLNLMKR